MRKGRMRQHFVPCVLFVALLVFSAAPSVKAECDYSNPFGFDYEYSPTVERGQNVTYTFWADAGETGYMEFQVTGQIPRGTTLVSYSATGDHDFTWDSGHFYWYGWSSGCQSVTVTLSVPENYGPSNLHNELEVTDWDYTYQYSADTELTGGVVSGLQLDLGSGSGGAVVGAQVRIPITLTNVPGYEISGTSNDVYYDTSYLEHPRAEIGVAGDSAEKTVQFNDFADIGDPGHVRVGVIGFNDYAMPDGIVAYLVFDVRSDAPAGETYLDNFPSATSPEGEPVAVGGNGAALTIIEVAGDCNNDGKVSIAEVQSVINMYLGILPPSGCADVSGNGYIEINEVQLTIVNYLNIMSLRGSAAARGGRSPKLSLGTAKGRPGEVITLPLTLRTNGTGVAAVSTDIKFDPKLLGSPTAQIGPSGENAGKTVESNLVEDGLFRVGVFGVNTEAMGDGVVATVSFTIASEAKPCVAVLGNAPSGSDPEGNALKVSGGKKKGVVKILRKKKNK